jgi:hypothetical protein
MDFAAGVYLCEAPSPPRYLFGVGLAIVLNTPLTLLATHCLYILYFDTNNIDIP